MRTSATGRSSGALLAPYGEAPGGESQDRGEVHLESYPQSVLVYVEPRMMVRGRYSPLFVPGPDKVESRRGLLPVGREVLPTHVGGHDLDVLLADPFPGRLLDLPRQLLVVDDGPVAALVGELVVGTVGFRDTPDEPLHDLRHPLPDLGVEGAYGALHLHRARDNVVRGAALEAGHGEDHATDRVHLARDDVLQVGNDLRPYGYGIHDLVRKSGVPALASYCDVEDVRRRHHRTVGYADLADGKPRPQVYPHHGVDPVHHTPLDQLLGAAGAQFFGVLEHEAHLAVDPVTHPGEYLRRPEQHRRVPVVAAGVHRAGVGGGELEVVLLGDRQGVNVRPDGDGAAGPVPYQPRDHAVPGGTRDLQSIERCQRLAYEPRGLFLVEGDFGVLVKVAPPCDHLFTGIRYEGVERCGFDLCPLPGVMFDRPDRVRSNIGRCSRLRNPPGCSTPSGCGLRRLWSGRRSYPWDTGSPGASRRARHRWAMNGALSPPPGTHRR